MAGLGELLSGGTPAPAGPQSQEADPALKAGWTQFLNDPANKAALLTFGLQAMAGSHGSVGQQLAFAAGRGLEAGGDVVKEREAQALAQQERLDKDNARSQALTQRQLDRESREKVAGQRVGATLTAAKIRAAARMEAQKLGLSAKDKKAYIDQVIKITNEQQKLTPINKDTLPQSLEKAKEAVGKARAAAGLPQIGPATSPGSPAAPAPAVSPQAAPAPATGKAPAINDRGGLILKRLRERGIDITKLTAEQQRRILQLMQRKQ